MSRPNSKSASGSSFPHIKKFTKSHDHQVGWEVFRGGRQPPDFVDEMLALVRASVHGRFNDECESTSAAASMLLTNGCSSSIDKRPSQRARVGGARTRRARLLLRRCAISSQSICLFKMISI